MASLGRLVVTLSANIAEFTGAMDKAAFIADQRSRAISRSIDQTLKVVGRTAAAVAAVLGNEIRRSLNIADDINDFSQAVGIGIREFQRFSYAAEQNGVSVDEFRMAMARLANAVTDDSQALRAMGIETRNAQGLIRPLGEILQEVVDRFSRYRDGAEKTALAQDLFGRSGAALIPMLNQGTAGLEALGDQAERSGRIMSDDTVRGAALLADQLDAIKGSARGVANQLLSGMIPALQDVARGLNYSSGQMDLWRSTGEALGKFVRQLAGGLVALSGAALAAAQAVYALGKSAMAAASGEFTEALNVLKDGQDQALRSLYQGLDKAAVILGVGTAAVVDQRRRLEEEARRAATAADQTLTAPVVAKVSEAATAEEQRLKKIIAILDQVKQSYRDLIFTQNEQRVQDAEALGATAEQIAQIQAYSDAIAIRKAQEASARLATEQMTRTLEEQRRLYEAFPSMYYDAASASERYRLDLEKLEEQKKALIVAGRSMAEVEEWAANRTRQLADQYRETIPAIEDFAHAIGTAFEDAVINGRSLRDVLQGLLQDILRIILRISVTTPLQNALIGAMQGGGGILGWLGSLFGGGSVSAANAAASNAAASATQAVARASGGLVQRGGTYVVGEQGPELFTPTTNGRILTNANLAALADREPAPQMVRQVFNITTPNPDGFRLSERQIARRMRMALAV